MPSFLHALSVPCSDDMACIGGAVGVAVLWLGGGVGLNLKIFLLYIPDPRDSQ